MPGTSPARPDPALEDLRIQVVTQPRDPQGVTLCVGEFDTPLGRVIAMEAEGVIWGLGFVGDLSPAEVRADLLSRWPDIRTVDAPEALAPVIQALLTGSGDLTVRLTGTEFQLQVWRGLLEVPRGQVISYAVLAERIGRPNALRAVGTAVGQNPVSWIVPCHRVTRTGGALGGYHWGAGVKRVLLTHEGASVAPPALPLM